MIRGKEMSKSICLIKAVLMLSKPELFFDLSNVMILRTSKGSVGVRNILSELQLGLALNGLNGS
jgi:hypothetical protein